ncbi:hypothetical protein SAMN04488509_102270 [Aquimonas voraii]|uniref:Uncharacterized protein n=1 Tax=Aquimonas voraii TaxID=265719 RepID=A0A1G6UCJ3_9GAMM|nr:hypothetical protein SAMN04488509_102270 [Aquimonas voraii]
MSPTLAPVLGGKAACVIVRSAAVSRRHEFKATVGQGPPYGAPVDAAREGRIRSGA